MVKIKSLAPDGYYSCGDQSINGYNQTGQELKEQFLRDARALLKQTSEFLTRLGWTECEIRVNSAGVAGSGGMYAEFWKPADRSTLSTAPTVRRQPHSADGKMACQDARDWASFCSFFIKRL